MYRRSAQGKVYELEGLCKDKFTLWCPGLGSGRARARERRHCTQRRRTTQETGVRAVGLERGRKTN
jgi:hypothetical protein